MRTTQQQRLRDEKHGAIIAYGRKLTLVPIASTGGTFRMPIERKGTSGRTLCGLPINCCDPREHAESFIVIGGEHIGLCDLAARAFSTMRGMDGLGEHTDRIRVIRDRNTAIKTAQRFHRDPVGGTKQLPGLKTLTRQDAARHNIVSLRELDMGLDPLPRAKN